MSRRMGIPVLAALVATMGCELTSVEVAVPEDVLVVEAYLRTDVDRQEAFLYRTLPGEAGTLDVTDAVLRVRDEEGTTLSLFFEGPSGACVYEEGLERSPGGSCYRSEPAPGFVRPGTRYTLAVSLPDGRRLEGETEVPGAFGIVRPAADSCVVGTTSYPITWTASEGAWSYQAIAELRGLAQGLRARGVEDPPDDLTLLGLAIGQADTSITFPGEFGVFDRFDLDRELILALQEGLPAGARAGIVIGAGDGNYVNWVRGGNFNPSGQVRVPSVTGDGTGVFGSLVVQRRTLVTSEEGESPLPTCQ